MFTLSPGSVCDVCAEEYDPHCIPHSIPCGHIFCWSCCHKIVQKTLPNLQAACPFCSDHFTSGDVRLLRTNFSESGRVTPRGRGGLSEAFDRHSPLRGEDRFPIVEPCFSRTHAETRRLEDKVAKVAARKCSVEEVSTLYKELDEWLIHDESFNVQSYSLSSSAALLKTILTNHIAHSEAVNMAKGVEVTLKGKLDEMESRVSKLKTDLKQYQAFYTRKVQECEALRVELTRCTLKSAYSRAANLPARPSTAAPTGLSERRQSVFSSVASTYNAPAMPSMHSRFESTYSRSTLTSATGVQKPTNPARTTTPSIRSEAPMRASMRSSRFRTMSPIPPSRPSATFPQIINPSRSDDQERARELIYERWLPAPDVTYAPPTSKTIN
ncbi:uncharacterized protein EDB93DRAFT_1052476, partial [Suillus bovinus]|uniref:uncharacterized protein n=1 Tax=Suillus bovinus TaxID=48563 RepID=UPI001B869F6E